MPVPNTEARSLLQVARRNGDNLETVRASITITAAQLAELRLWSAREPWLAERIRNLIHFRRQVLREFNRLVEKTSTESAA